MTTKPMRLVRRPADKTRQEIEMERLRELRRGENVPFGEREIDNTPTANVIPVDDILSRSFKQIGD